MEIKLNEEQGNFLLGLYDELKRNNDLLLKFMKEMKEFNDFKNKMEDDRK